MNMKEAISVLKRNGVNVYKRGKDRYLIARQGGNTWTNYKESDGFYSSREVVRFARECFTSEGKRENSIGKMLKHETKNNRRTVQRDLIRKGEFDKLSCNEDKKTYGDRWSWD